jgi:hypothetical protein
MNTLMMTLRQILGSFQHTYVIFGALDECTERDELLRLIDEIVSWKLGSLHILATSRKERDIEDSLTCLVSPQIYIQSALVESDNGSGAQNTKTHPSGLSACDILPKDNERNTNA